jgi:valyl-tRNA synthetase
VARDAATAFAHARARHGRDVALQQDADVLDTWFSSALWPFSTLGWPEQTPELARFYPTSVLVTGFDIIFFWVARMIMLGLKFAGDVPFREVYVHGLIRDAEGQKMSKSKGNVIDPLDLVDGITLDALLAKRTSGLMQPHLAPAIEKATRKQFPDGIAAYGTDALRFTFAALATQSRDIRFDTARVAGNRNFCNKLWNAARFVNLVLQQCADVAAPGPEAPSVADRWISSRLGIALRAVDTAFAEYRFDFAASALYEFCWHEYCDWYLELVKPVLQSTDYPPDARRAARRTLLQMLETLLRALHPLMPFITEDIWQRIAPLAGAAGASIMLAPWPDAAAFPADAAAEDEVAWIRAAVLGVRQVRGEMDISPARRVPLLIQHASARDRTLAERHGPLLARLGGLQSLRVLGDDERAPPAAAAILGELVLLVPMAGLIDPRAELERLQKRLQKITAEIRKARGKLANDSFTRAAPAGVVQQERVRLDEFERTLAGLERHIAQVQQLAAQA